MPSSVFKQQEKKIHRAIKFRPEKRRKREYNTVLRGGRISNKPEGA
jgi:hypothetical protein